MSAAPAKPATGPPNGAARGSRRGRASAPADPADDPFHGTPHASARGTRVVRASVEGPVFWAQRDVWRQDRPVRPATAAEPWLEAAVAELAAGGIVAIPTETVYGLAADALDANAVARIFEAKGRPNDNPLIVHVADAAQVLELTREVPPIAKMLMETFWPGPLTLVLPKSDAVPDAVTAGLPTVGLRCPGHPVALRVLEALGRPLAAPSANRSGTPSPTSAQHVLQDLAGRVPLIIDAGNCPVGIESTVLDLSIDPPRILREGAVTLAALRKVIPTVRGGPTEGALATERAVTLVGDPEEAIPRSPGMKYRHYAPETTAVLVVGDAAQRRKDIEAAYRYAARHGRSWAFLVTDESAPLGDQVHRMGPAAETDRIARGLYDWLRRLDRSGCDLIVVEAIEERGMGIAVMDRMRRATRGRQLDVARLDAL